MALSETTLPNPNMEVLDIRGGKATLRFSRECFALFSKEKALTEDKQEKHFTHFLVLEQDAGQALEKFLEERFIDKLGSKPPMNYSFKTLCNGKSCVGYPNVRLKEDFDLSRADKTADLQVTAIIWKKDELPYLSLMDLCPYEGERDLLSGATVVL